MQILPRVGWVIPILVACSSLGTALVAVSIYDCIVYVAKFKPFDFNDFDEKKSQLISG